MEFTVDVKLQGMLVAEPGKVMPTFQKEFLAGLTEATGLVEYETKMRTPVAFGELRKSVSGIVRGGGLDLEGVIGSPVQYALPVEVGAAPHFPPSDPIELWVKRKNLSLNYEGVELTIRQVAFLVARKINQAGLAANWMFRDALEASTTRIDRILRLAQERITALIG